MADPKNFVETVRALLARHQETSLARRWEDAEAVDPKPQPQAFWIRESADLINVVWLGPRGLIDITWFPANDTSTLYFQPMSAVMGIEMREGPEAGPGFGAGFSGNIAVRVFTSSDKGGLLWIAAPEADNADALREFVRQVSLAMNPS